MNGYAGKILYVDLTTGETREEPVDERLARLFIGGNGFCARLLYDRIGPETDPLGPENVIVFAVGPLTDTAIPSTSRACIGTKSPLNGLFFDSTFGGSWPTSLKRTGYDAVVVAGRAERPVYLSITDQGVSLRPAEDLWGKWIRATCDAVCEREGGKADVIAIGPAGENLVRFAAMAHTWRKSRDGIAGRGGMGAVMGAKNLKAVAVFGRAKTGVADPKGLKEFVGASAEDVRTGTKALNTYGTPVLVRMINELGALGTRNLQRETFEDCLPISGERMKEEIWEKDTTCFKCPVACGKNYAVTEGEFAGTAWKMPEYETIFALGTMLDHREPGALLKANLLADELGMDTISLGVTLSFAFECFEKGILKESDIGFPLNFGDYRTMLRLVEDTAHRRGFGDLLAEGSWKLAERWGEPARKFLYAAKGLEMPAHSARALKGMSIGYATGTRGGSHHDTRPTLQYASDHDNRSVDGKPLFAVRTQNFSALDDSLTQCRFTSERGYGAMINENYARMVNLVTGWDVSAEELERTGERICNLERAFNVREGVRRKDDTLPYRVQHVPIPDGPHRGMHCPPAELSAMLDEYYALRGWDSDGVPTEKTLRALDLDFAAEDLAVRNTNSDERSV
ncbi:MAG: aldehyde ferredoxin oxidoreductase family protein [Nitrospinota bacterium]